MASSFAKVKSRVARIPWSRWITRLSTGVVEEPAHVAKTFKIGQRSNKVDHPAVSRSPLAPEIRALVAKALQSRLTLRRREIVGNQRAVVAIRSHRRIRQCGFFRADAGLYRLDSPPYLIRRAGPNPQSRVRPQHSPAGRCPARRNCSGPEEPSRFRPVAGVRRVHVPGEFRYAGLPRRLSALRKLAAIRVTRFVASWRSRPAASRVLTSTSSHSVKKSWQESRMVHWTL
jgi:hypothetical protein